MRDCGWLSFHPSSPAAAEAFSIHISFHTGNRTQTPDELPPRMPELLKLNQVRETLRDL